ncbi:MAG: hypothetical protein U0234_21280 [Sandaracinus sp.]
MTRGGATRLFPFGALLLALGCTTPGAQVDASTPMQDAWSLPGVPGTVVLGSEMEGPTLPIEGFWLRIETLRIVGDRGAEFDPQRHDLPLLAVDADGVEIPIEVPPALYSAVFLGLDATGADEGEPVLELVFGPIDGTRFDVQVHERLQLLARCELGAIIDTRGGLRVGVDFELGEAVIAMLREPVPAPGPDGTVLVDETTAPSAVAAFRARLIEEVHAECGH